MAQQPLPALGVELLLRHGATLDLLGRQHAADRPVAMHALPQLIGPCRQGLRHYRATSAQSPPERPAEPWPASSPLSLELAAERQLDVVRGAFPRPACRHIRRPPPARRRGRASIRHAGRGHRPPPGAPVTVKAVPPAKALARRGRTEEAVAPAHPPAEAVTRVVSPTANCCRHPPPAPRTCR